MTVSTAFVVDWFGLLPQTRGTVVAGGTMMAWAVMWPTTKLPEYIYEYVSKQIELLEKNFVPIGASWCGPSDARGQSNR